MNFFLERGCAVTGKDIRVVSEKAVSLLSDEVALHKMRKAMDLLDYAPAAERIRDNIIAYKGEKDSHAYIHSV